MLRTSSETLGRWREEFSAVERKCPWPGPRPLDIEDERKLLVGRDADIELFLREVESHRLVVLAGSSGVGKSSILARGLVPQLREAGFWTAECRDWSGHANSDNPSVYLATRLLPDLVSQGFIAPEESLFWSLDERIGSKAVVILDQFEELIRYSPTLASSIYRIILDINYQTNIKVVISLRSEYMHQLRPLENQAKPFSMTTIYLDEVPSEFIPQVIGSANQDGKEAISDDAIQTVSSWWIQAASRDSSLEVESGKRVGLLHLQALLYTLFDQTKGSLITGANVEEFASLSGSAEAIFERALEQSVNIKIERCKEAALGASLDKYLVNGTVDAVVRMSKHLSSAGYKLAREAYDLMTIALSPDFGLMLDELELTKESENSGTDGSLQEGQMEALLDVLVGAAVDETREAASVFLFDARTVIAERADGNTAEAGKMSWVERLHVPRSYEGRDPLPRHVDPRESSGGPLLGTAPANSLIEQIRRFSFALLWLIESSVVRVSTPGGQVMISLIHDGFGNAIESWASSQSSRPILQLTRLAASRADEMNWRGDDDHEWPELTGNGSAIIWPNLRWRGNWIRATFDNVVFLNCDFRGSWFEDCIFRGVSFVNCMLDGTVFSQCVFAGFTASAKGEVNVGAPHFLVDCSSDPELSAVFGAYQNRLQTQTNHLLSRAPGLPAIPSDEGDAQCVDWEPIRGGAAIYGGRLSSFMVRNCEFEDGASVSFRRVAGSGSDFVIHAASRLEFFSCALRHICVTVPEALSDASLEVTARDSMLVGTWIGEHLTGSVEIQDCSVLHLWNESRSLAVNVGESSKVFGLVNANIDSSCEFMSGHEDTVEIEEIELAERIALITRLMDYRRDPYTGDID